MRPDNLSAELIALVFIGLAYRFVVATSDDHLARRTYEEMPKIFNFGEYQHMFSKIYTPYEEPIRRNYMLARAIRSFISRYRYNVGQSSSYLLLNHLSDRTENELGKMLNKHLLDSMKYEDQNGSPDSQTGANVSTVQVESKDNQVDEIPQFDVMHIESDILELVSDQLDSSVKEKYGLDTDEWRLALKDADSNRRAKREASDQSDQLETGHRHVSQPPFKTHSLSLNQLMRTPSLGRLNRPTALKLKSNPPSNNPNYQPPEEASYGLRDDYQEPVQWTHVMDESSWIDDMKSMRESQEAESGGNFKGTLSTEEQVRAKKYARVPNLPDQVFTDHRTSFCLFLPRDQEACGSCYAYASIALLEWLNCIKTGTLIAFSEQYMVDCGLSSGCYGCSGSAIENISSFVHNYGLELRINYMPHRNRQNECPYHEETDPKTMGYLRMNLSDSIRVDGKLFEDFLQATPIIISLKTEKTSFSEYGGGIHMGMDCVNVKSGDHAVLLVGHGRAEGLEYWLIRNSYSVSWGEGGYMRLWKGSPCVSPNYGYIFGTIDGIKYSEPQKNPQHNMKLMRQNYAKSVREQLNNRHYTVPA